MKPIRGALSGSGFKYPAHVGAAKAILAAGYSWKELGGTSGGSIVAMLLAWGMPIADMEDMTLSRDWSDMLTISPWTLLTAMGACNGKNLESWLTDTTKGAKFSDLKCDLSVVCSDVSGQVPFVFSTKLTPDVPLHLAVRASTAIPFIYTPVYYNGAVLVDGGLCNNMPTDLLVRDEVPRIGIQLVSKQTPIKPGSTYTALDMLERVAELGMSSNENTHVDLAKLEGAKMVFIETGYASGLDRNSPREIRQRLMDDGFAATALAIKEMEAA